MAGPNTVDLSEDARKILESKEKRRAALRAEFLKLRTSPFQHASGEGGYVFDPALQRYNALKVSGFEYFKPTGKNALMGLAYMVIPFGVLAYFSFKIKLDQEAKYRRGEVAYKDRNFKFI